LAAMGDTQPQTTVAQHPLLIQQERFLVSLNSADEKNDNKGDERCVGMDSSVCVMSRL